MSLPNGRGWGSQCLERSDPLCGRVLSLRSERGVAGSITHLDALLS
jgi:hypothetical protein